MNEITLKQAPIIEHKLKEIGKQVDERLVLLNIENQVATEETVKTLKQLRADLNKELATWETERKNVKSAINAPYNEFESMYKTEISQKYETATRVLTKKIDSIEDKIRQEKETNLKAYFTELCACEKLDFLTFEQTGIVVNLSTTEKKYKEQIISFVENILSDLRLIGTEQEEIKAEILVEYKKTLNCSNAITTVRQRKESEKLEKARLMAQRVIERKNQLISLGFEHVDITSSYDYDADIHVTLDKIETLSHEDWLKLIAEKETAIAEKKKAEQNKNANLFNQQQITAPILSAPEEVKAVEKYNARFLITDTRERLMILRDFLQKNGYTYKNIDKEGNIIT